VKTLDRRRVYLRGLLIGATAGLFLGAFLATYFSGRSLAVNALAQPARFRVGDAVFGGLWGLLGGLALGLGGAAFVVSLGSSEGREQALEGAPPAVFPGMFGEAANDPFAAMKQRIDAEEPAAPGEEPPAPPAVMPEKCPSCGEKLDAQEEPSAFCYHCGAALA